MTTKQVLRAAGRGLGYVGAGALCVPLGTFQWFMQAGSYERAITRAEIRMREATNDADRERFRKEVDDCRSDMPTPWNFISGMYQNLKPYSMG